MTCMPLQHRAVLVCARTGSRLLATISAASLNRAFVGPPPNSSFHSFHAMQGDDRAWRGRIPRQTVPHGANAAEVYGIVGYLLSTVFFILWLLWAFTPDWVLQMLSVTYYPDKYWAVALPGYFFLLVVYLIILYNGSPPPCFPPK